MAQRLLQAVLPVAGEGEREACLTDSGATRWWWQPLDASHVLLQAVVAAERAEALTDRLQARFGNAEGFTLLLLPVEASLPAPEAQAVVVPGAPAVGARVSREELYEDLAEQTQLTALFAATVVLSTVVAAIGLIRGDLAILIGAMVIAPLLGPNVALSLSATLGDRQLALRALRANLGGFGIAFGLACLIGLLFQPAPDLPQLALRAQVHPADLLLASAAGSAGVLAFTTGLPAALIGVMVAVALLPPTVAAGLFLGAGDVPESGRALLLLLTNVVCVNAAGVATFLLRRVRPRTWWEGERAKRAARAALTTWLLLLAMVAALVVRLWLRGW